MYSTWVCMMIVVSVLWLKDYATYYLTDSCLHIYVSDNNGFSTII